MDAEMTNHLGYEKNDQKEKDTSNRRNGTTKKTLRSDQGPLEIQVPRDREGDFEPAIVPKHQHEFKSFDDTILSMDARGMTTREIAGHLKEIYGTDVSPKLIQRCHRGVPFCRQHAGRRYKNNDYHVNHDRTRIRKQQNNDAQ
jgi:transposase-like protein